MPGNTKRRRRKHRGTQTGSIDKRGRTTPRSRQEAMARAKSGSQKTDRRDRPPTWGGAAMRGGIFALLLFPMALLFHQPIGAAIILTLFAASVYIPLGYYTDGFFYRRRQAKLRAEAQARKEARGKATKPRSEES